MFKFWRWLEGNIFFFFKLSHKSYSSFTVLTVDLRALTIDNKYEVWENRMATRIDGITFADAVA